MKLKEKLVCLRKEKGLSQLEVAEELNVSRQAVSRWEAGAAVPATDNLRYLSELYHVSVDVLLNDSMELLGKDERIPGEQIPSNKENAKSKMSKQVITTACFVLLAVVLLICIAVTHQKQNTEITPIGEMKMEDDAESPSVGDFSIGW